VIYGMVTAEAKAEHARRLAELSEREEQKKREQQEAQRHQLHLVSADGTVMNVDGGEATVELNHEASAGHHQQRKEDGDDIGARAAANA
jgi:hypothetical protein